LSRAFLFRLHNSASLVHNRGKTTRCWSKTQSGSVIATTGTITSRLIYALHTRKENWDEQKEKRVRSCESETDLPSKRLQRKRKTIHENNPRKTNNNNTKKRWPTHRAIPNPSQRIQRWLDQEGRIYSLLAKDLQLKYTETNVNTPSVTI
jgi:hypothetical protein